ncbi:hypothetical protein DFAR_4030003 [Desulfarculales bacterium]
MRIYIGQYWIKRDHHLLRLESSSTTAPTGDSLFLQKSDQEVSNS